MSGGLLFCPICKNYFGTPAIFREYINKTPASVTVKNTFIICPCGQHKMLVVSEATNKFTHKNVFWMSIKECDMFDFQSRHKSFRGISLEMCSEDDPELYHIDYVQKNIKIRDYYFKPKVLKK